MRLEVLLLTSLVALACAPQAGAPRPLSSVVILLDQSASAGDAGTRCSEAGARLEELMDMRQPFEVVVLGTGTVASGSEPTVVVNRRAWKGSSRALFKDSNARQAERDEWIADVVRRCTRGYQTSKISPIFRAVERSLESLRARGLELKAVGKAYQARLYIHSDLSEGSEPRLLGRMRRGRRGRSTKLPKLDLQGVAIRACTGIHLRDSTDQRRMHELWRKVLDGVPFDVACPRWEGGSK